MPQRCGSASSYGKKYALGNLLLIDDTADADATNMHNKSTQTNFTSSNKPMINKNNIDQAKKFLSNGGLIKTLKDKYEIEPEVLKELVNE
jgi:hypothetical protein